MVAVGFSKIVVVATNVIFMIFGLAILIIGIVFKLGWDDVRAAFDDKATQVDFDLQAAGDAAGVSAITFGSIILIVSLLGCAGACCQNRCMLGTYGVIVLMVLIGQVAIVAFVSSKGNEAEDNLVEGLLDTIKDYNETGSTDLSKSWSAIFKLGDCCAVTNFRSDFQNHTFGKDLIHRQEAGITGDSIPITCCRGVDYEDDFTKKMFVDHKACLDNPSDQNAYVEGCYSKIKDWINDHKQIIVGVGVAVLVFELILTCMAFFLCCRDNDD